MARLKKVFIKVIRFIEGVADCFFFIGSIASVIILLVGGLVCEKIPGLSSAIWQILSYSLLVTFVCAIITGWRTILGLKNKDEKENENSGLSL